jgi:hypothetical protein
MSRLKVSDDLISGTGTGGSQYRTDVPGTSHHNTSIEQHTAKAQSTLGKGKD